MEKYCVNHSFSEAHWYCKKCDTSYCFTCVEKKNFRFAKDEPIVHICPTCKRMVEWTGIQHISDNVLVGTAKALIYPFSSFSLIVIAVLTCLGMLFTDNIYLNEVLFTIIWGLTASYGLNVLTHTVNGKNQAPNFTHIPPHELMSHIFMVVKQSSILLVAAVLFIGALEIGHPVLAYAIMICLAAILPMGMMKAVTSRSFKAFFDLTRFTDIFKKVGTQYLMLSILYMPVIAVFHLYISQSPRLATPLICYLMIVIHRLLGQMILTCHKELDYSLNYEHFKKQYSLEALHGFKA
ncbi:hypothetical protein JCM14469_32150 [Desulfatiferula olefinivorans]